VRFKRFKDSKIQEFKDSKIQKIQRFKEFKDFDGVVLLLVVPELVGELFVEPSSKAGEGARRADEVMKDSKIQRFKDSKRRKK
jgi:hypothetical protein